MIFTLFQNFIIPRLEHHKIFFMGLECHKISIIDHDLFDIYCLYSSLLLELLEGITDE